MEYLPAQNQGLKMQNKNILCTVFPQTKRKKPCDGESALRPDWKLPGNNVQNGSYSALSAQPSVLLCNNKIMLRLLGKNSDDSLFCEAPKCSSTSKKRIPGSFSRADQHLQTGTAG